MALLDWIAVCVPLVLLLVIAKYTSRHLKSVADYMAGGRCAGRYMLCVARGEMAAGAAVFVAMFEIFSRAGFTYVWWNWINMPVATIIAISGFVVYRYRETRALTLAQFFEMRYSRPFRIFSGLLGFAAGIMNFGIIPAVAARFFVYFMGFPQYTELLGFSIPTFVIIMTVLMAITVYLAVKGGQLTIMITDCTSGLVDQWLLLVVIIALMVMFSWSQISDVMLSRPPGQSLMDPFNSLGLKDFNLWYVLMSVLVSIYGTMAWQNASAYNSAALNPHESRMGNVLGRWREFAKQLAIILLALGAVTFLNHPDFAAESAPVSGILDGIANPQIQKQMTVPSALSIMLPAGLKGLLCAIVLTGVFGGDTTHLHSWGSMFVQDVILPFRKTPLSPEKHIRYLRTSMIGVGVFAVLFGTFFTQTEYVVMWFRITMAIYVGGAGSVIIGGLYWKKGTTAAAWAAMLTGSGLSVGGIIIRQLFSGFPFNGMQISFGASLIAIAVYIIVSLLTCRNEFNLDRMLHRGEYAVKEDQVLDAPKSKKKLPMLSRMIGITEKFSRADRWIAAGIFWWGMCWVCVMVIGSVWNLIQPWSGAVWARFWWWSGVALPLGISVFTTFWFTYGVLRDIRRFYAALRNERIDIHDDGSVTKTDA